MSNVPQGNSANVIVGPARLLIAPVGTTLPTLDGTVDPVTWDAAFMEVGYTEKGTVFNYTPKVKDILVDEEMSAVKKILDAEDASISAELSESTLANLNYAISASEFASNMPDGTHAGYQTVKVGSGALTECIVGLEGLSPEGYQRIIIGYRAVAQAKVNMTFMRAGKVITPVDFSLLADTARPAGERLCIVYDKTASHT